MPRLASGRLCWKGPCPARLRISRDVTYCWTWGLTLNSDSVSSSQLTRLTANCRGADHKVWEWDLCQRVSVFFFWHATNYENQDLEWTPPWLTNLEYGALSLSAPGQHQGALSHLRGFLLAPRPSQWGRRVGRLILLLWNACSQAPAFLVQNLPGSGVCVSAPGSGHRAWSCISWARPPVLFSETSLLLSRAAPWEAALFWHDLHHPSSRLRTSCCSEGCFLSSRYLPSEAKLGRFLFCFF